MKISKLLQKENIIAELKTTHKESILQELAQAISVTHPYLKESEILATLLEREKLGSTGIGSGVAIPHGKLRDLKEIVAAFGRSTAGVDFESQDGEPTHLFFALLAPQDSAGMHLQALAKLSRLLKQPSFRQKLMKAGKAQQIFQVLEEEDQRS